MGPEPNWEDKERTCIIATDDFWEATRLVGNTASSIKTETITNPAVVGKFVERATQQTKSFENTSGANLEEILTELDDIVLQARGETVLVGEEPKQPGRIPTDPEILESLGKRLSDVEDKMRLRLATETINCLIQDP